MNICDCKCEPCKQDQHRHCEHEHCSMHDEDVVSFAESLED